MACDTRPQRSRAMNRTIFAAFTFICAVTSAQAQSLSAEDLARRTVERRAVEAVIWGMPAVNFDLLIKRWSNPKALGTKLSTGHACRIGRTRRSRRTRM